MYKIIFFLLLFLANNAYAQHLSLRNYNDEQHLLDKLETSTGNLSTVVCLFQKANSASLATNFAVNFLDSTKTVRNFNIKQFLANNTEWLSTNYDNVPSRYPILKSIYKTPANFFSLGNADYFFAINPVINYQLAKEQNNNSTLFLNTRGFELRGHILKRLSFYTWLTDNQERTPNATQLFTLNTNQVPGAGYWKNNLSKGNLYTDYSLARGYLTLNGLNNHLDFTFGHDRFFLGDGYRSLFLGDHGNNMLFAKLNARFWKINYQNIWLELTPTLRAGLPDGLRPKKYAALHHLSINIRPWLNVGAFEGVVFGRKDYFEFQYLNPVIFYRTAEQQVGSPDNALLGFNTKIMAAKNVQLYGQILLDEFKFGEIASSKKWWANKYALQVGAKYFDAFGIKNFDAQLEVNRIRPYTYSYYDSVRDFTNYNQSLAHPNGNNLLEQIIVLRYQPINKLVASLDLIARKQGVDTAANFATGGNIYKSSLVREKEYGVTMFSGVPVTTIYANLNLSYNIMNNLYVDGGVIYRKDNSPINNVAPNSTTAYLGLRLNAKRRKYNF